MIVTFNKKDNVEALDFLHNIGKSASEKFIFNGNDFPSLGNSKDFGEGSLSYLSALKNSLSSEPPPTIHPVNQLKSSDAPIPPVQREQQTQTSVSPPKELVGLNQRIEALERSIIGINKALESSAKQQNAFFDRMTEIFTPSSLPTINLANQNGTASITQEQSETQSACDTRSTVDSLASQVMEAISKSICPAIESQIKQSEKRFKKIGSSLVREFEKELIQTKESLAADLQTEVFTIKGDHEKSSATL